MAAITSCARTALLEPLRDFLRNGTLGADEGAIGTAPAAAPASVALACRTSRHSLPPSSGETSVWLQTRPELQSSMPLPDVGP